jgi:glycosyltransferase involved in cell wall biosynthesis
MARRILLLSPTPTHPTTAGNRAYILASARLLAAQGHTVHLAYAPREEPPHQALREHWGDRLHVLPYRRPRSRALSLRRRLGRWVGLPGLRYNLPVDAWYDPAIEPPLRALVDEHGFDTLVVHYVFLSRAFLGFGPQLRKILVTHDVFTNRYRRYLDEGLEPRWFSTSRRQEARALERADAVVALQDEEAAFFRSLTRRPVVTLGHPIEIRPQPWEDAVPGRILMVGSRNPLNVEAARAFLARVLPEVRKAVPQAHLAVAGTLGEALEAGPELVRLGRLEDLAPAYARASAVVIPVTGGTGLKIKLVEALGYGRPVVSTRHGATGVAEDAAPAPLLRTEGLEDMPRALVAVLEDPARARALAAAGLDYAEEWNRRCQESLRRILEPPPATG